MAAVFMGWWTRRRWDVVLSGQASCLRAGELGDGNPQEGGEWVHSVFFRVDVPGGRCWTMARTARPSVKFSWFSR